MNTRGWAVTDVGRKRDHNEDSFLCNDELRLYAVADGMGGHLGGERASRMAVEIVEREMIRARERGLSTADGSPAVGQALREVTMVAARAIYEAAHADAQHAGMGTTLTTAAFHNQHLTLCHVGDSRAYLYRDGRA